MIKDLFAANVHIGHNRSKWNPKIKPYLHSIESGVHVFDLNKTVAGIEKAQQFLKAAKLKNSSILFVGTKPQISMVIKKQIADKKVFWVDEKWAPGLLTNHKEIRKRIDHYLNLKSQFETGEINKYTKKEVARFSKELAKLEKLYAGVAQMRKKPDVIIVLDAVGNRLAIQESKKAGSKIIALVDSNGDPDDIDFVIPGNDDSVKSVGIIVDKLLEALA